jgi:acetyl esterase/lipase
VPIGYLVSVLVGALATVISLRPRPTRGPRASPSFIFESVANELPFLLVYWLVANTALAATQGDIDSPLGWLALVIAACTLAGSAVVIARAAQARAVLDHALTVCLVDNMRDASEEPDGRRRTTLQVALRTLISPVRIPARSVRRDRNIAYGPAGVANRLDMYRHRSNPCGSPVLIYFHPGGFVIGKKSREARVLFGILANRGWLCISANYRLRQAGAFPNNVIDAKRVIAWLRSRAADYGADPTTIVMCGGSAGAYLAAMCALTPNDSTFQPGFEQADTSVSAAIGLYGFYGSAASSETRPSDPGTGGRPDVPPFFVIHGERDPMVTAGHAKEFAKELRATSTSPVLYAELPGGQHNFDRFPSIRFFAVVDAIESFANWVRSRSTLSTPDDDVDDMRG